MLPTRNRAMKMPEQSESQETKRLGPEVLHGAVFGTTAGYQRHLHHPSLR